MENLRVSMIKKEKQIERNETTIRENKDKLETLFANESIAIIEHMRESEGRYEITNIKNRLKELKT